jgi:hypothetical protein
MKKRFIIQFCLTLAVVLFISTVVYFLICKGLRQAKRDAIGKFNYIIHDTSYYNTVFFGTSTVHAGVNPILFDSVCGTHSFNAAMDGLGIAELNMLVHKYLKSHGSPRQVFIGCDEITLAMKTRVWYFPQYYPFVGDTDLKELVALEPKLLLGKYFPPAAVTYFDDPLKNLALIGLLKDNKRKDYDLNPGGVHLIRNKKMTEEVERIGAYYLASKHGWGLLEKTIAECRNQNAEVNIILPPRYNYFIADSSAPFLAHLKTLEEKYGTKTFIYATDARFSSKELFFDRTHLNEQGAELFTGILAKDYSLAKP